MLFADIDILDENLDLQHPPLGGREGRARRLPGQAGARRRRGGEAYGEVYDGRGKLLVPAFYNAHAHAPMTLSARLRREPAPAGVAQRHGVAVRGEDDARGQLLGHASGLRRDGALRRGELLRHVLRHRRARARRGGERPEGKPVCESELCLRAEAVRTTTASCAAVEEYVREVPRRRLTGASSSTTTSTPSTRRTRETCTDIAAVREGARACACTCTPPRRRREHEECKQRHDGLTPVQLLREPGRARRARDGRPLRVGATTADIDLHGGARACSWPPTRPRT